MHAEKPLKSRMASNNSAFISIPAQTFLVFCLPFVLFKRHIFPPKKKRYLVLNVINLVLFFFFFNLITLKRKSFKNSNPTALTALQINTSNSYTVCAVSSGFHSGLI